MKKQRGFTLAELLVATVLISMVMASVYALFFSILVPWRAVEHQYDTYREARNALTLVERELNNAVPGAAHLFEGSDDEVTFFAVTEPMDVEKAEGRHLMRVSYRFKKSAGEIEREEALVTTPLPQPPAKDKPLDRGRVKVKNKKKFTVATNVEDFSIRYVWMPQPPERKREVAPGRIQPVYATMHRERWGYPQGVEFTLKLRDPERKDAFNTVEKIVPIRITTGLLGMKELTSRLGSGVSR